MARFKDYNYDQDKLLPIRFDRQILPGSFEYNLSYLVDHELDLSIFEHQFAPGCLIQELDSSVDEDAEAIWIDEAKRRYQEFKEGKINAIPGDEVMHQARHRLK